MSILRKTIVATALLGAGLGATTGAAFATESGHTGDHTAMTMEHDGHGGHGDKKDSDGGANAAGVQKRCANPTAVGQQGQDQEGLANASDVQTTVPLNACNNDIPVNVLGVQVPIQDDSANVPVASPTGQDDEGDGDNGGILGGIL